MMCDHGNGRDFMKEKKAPTLIQWGFKVVITFLASSGKMMSCTAKLLKASIPAKMPLRAYLRARTSQEGSDAHRLGKTGLSESQPQW